MLARYFQRTWVRGEGHRLWDADGREYLDFACGLAVTVLGHAHPAVSAAIHAQTDQLLHMCNGLGYLPPVTQLADELVATLPAAARLGVVRELRRRGDRRRRQARPPRRRVGRPSSASRGGFHGRTYAAMSLTTSNINYRTGHGPLIPDIHISRFPSVYRGFGGDEAGGRGRRPSSPSGGCSRRPCRRRQVAAFLIEPVTGEGGYEPAPVAFLQELRALADQHGILLIADEVQTGIARTGRMWGFEHADIVPDVVVVAKGIANGLPLSAIVASTARMQALGPRGPRLDLRWQPRVVRRGRRGAAHHPRGGPGRERRRTRRRADERPPGDRGGGPAHRRRPRAGA